MTAFKVPGTSAVKPLMSSMGKAVPMSRAGLGSASGLAASGEARPMTSVSGAGFSSKDNNKAFDPLNIGTTNKGPAPPLAEKSENSSEDKAKELERNVHKLLEASAIATVQKDKEKALEKAKEAGKAERSLCKFRESHGLVEQVNIDLTYSICFNLANTYYHNKMYEEALNTYQLIVKNKQYPQSGRLRVNMGNIYYDQKKFPQAIKMYRMALDQIPSTGKELKFRILRNIGNAFVKLGQFQDAIDNYELIMDGSADVQTGFNLMLCLFARGDKKKMERHFIKFLTIPIPGITEEEEEKIDEIEDTNTDRPDALKEDLNRQREEKNEKIIRAARLIAPIIDDRDDWEAGYKWVIKWIMEQLRTDHETVASKLELDLYMTYMKKRRFEDAIKGLKEFERKDKSLRAMAGTNLSFIYFLEGDYEQARKYADMAIQLDRYNAKALVNKGNCLYMGGDYSNAKEMYLEAVGVEADCVEAIYNLGLVNLKINAIQEAHHAFDKLHTILPSVPEALFQLGAIYEHENKHEQAAKTFELMLSKITADPNLCARLGQVYEKMGDELHDEMARHWNSESHRHYPVNLNVISWLGVWYVKREEYEQAIEYFERAALVQPGEVKWRLMVASCFRRQGNFPKALQLYQKIHEDPEHSDNVESLMYLVTLCKDLERPVEEIEKYEIKLEKLKRAQGTANPQQTGAGGVSRAAPTNNGRSDRPGRQDRPERSERVQSNSNNVEKTLSRVDEPSGRY
jgi:intraflagellar transport protein 88